MTKLRLVFNDFNLHVVGESYPISHLSRQFIPLYAVDSLTAEYVPLPFGPTLVEELHFQPDEVHLLSTPQRHL